MTQSSPFPLIAVDIGNARTKLGLFRDGSTDGLPEPDAVHRVDNASSDFGELANWLASLDVPCVSWWIGSVNRPVASRLVDWLRDRRPDERITLLAASDLALRVELPRPDMVGVDRLLDALAANHARRPDRAAVVVDVGTAITVDFISADGAFRGGAILPGIAMSARALNEFTDLLPLIDMTELTAPPSPVGQSTEAALASGLFWGAVGAVRELINQASTHSIDNHSTDNADVPEPDVFLTGGAGPAVAQLLGTSAHCTPQLTLAGIALSAQAMGG